MAIDITTIDAASFATRVGQVAAAELYALLSLETDVPTPLPNWFKPGWALPPEDASGLHDDAIADLQTDIEKLGEYVCQRDVDQGERLYRWGQINNLVPQGEWASFDFAGKKAFECFVATVRGTYRAILEQQTAIETARRLAGVPPAALKREDSIFEEEDGLGKLREESVKAAPLVSNYHLEQAAEQVRRDENARRQREQDEERARAEAEEKVAQAAAKKRPRKAPPPPLAAGEALPRQKANVGGRGNRKTT